VGAGSTALGPAVGEERGIHRARRRAGNRYDLQPLFFQQTVEHAPGACSARSIGSGSAGSCIRALFRGDEALLRAGQNEVIAGGVNSPFVFSVLRANLSTFRCEPKFWS
jgi:hypothetical protein